MRYFCLLIALSLTAACGPVPGDAPGLNPADFHGRWLVINYWAEWCTPCIKEIPELNQLAQQYPELAVVGVNFDGTEGDELARQLLQRRLGPEDLPGRAELLVELDQRAIPQRARPKAPFRTRLPY